MTASPAYLPSTTLELHVQRAAAGNDTNSYCDEPFWTVTQTTQDRSRRRRCARAATTRRTSLAHAQLNTTAGGVEACATCHGAGHGVRRRRCSTARREAWLVIAIALASCADERVLSGPCRSTARRDRAPAGNPRSGERRAFTARARAPRTGTSRCARAVTATTSPAAASGVSCLACHADGPTACATCHGDGPTSNAHRAARGTAASRAPSATSCRRAGTTTATSCTTASRSRRPRRSRSARAPRATLAPADRAGPPTWDGATCTNVYCHGDVLHAGGGTATAPRWDDPTPTGRLRPLSRRAAAEPRAQRLRDVSSAERAAHRRRRAGRPHDGLRRLSRQRELAGAAERPRRQHVHDRDRRRRASGAPAGAVADLARRSRARPVTRCRRRSTRRGHIDSPPPAEVDADARLGPRSADVRDRVVPRHRAAGVDVERAGRRAAAATASRRRREPHAGDDARRPARPAIPAPSTRSATSSSPTDEQAHQWSRRSSLIRSSRSALACAVASACSCCGSCCAGRTLTHATKIVLLARHRRPAARDRDDRQRRRLRGDEDAPVLRLVPRDDAVRERLERSEEHDARRAPRAQRAVRRRELLRVPRRLRHVRHGHDEARRAAPRLRVRVPLPQHAARGGAREDPHPQAVPERDVHALPLDRRARCWNAVAGAREPARSRCAAARSAARARAATVRRIRSAR